jgi:ABC-type multidrug transport system, ATPase and permease components
MSINSFRQDEEIEQVLNSKTLIRLYKYLFHYKKQITTILLVMALTTGVSLMNPLLIQRAININVTDKDIFGLIQTGVIGLIINLVFFVCIKYRMKKMAEISNQVLLRIRQELYTHIQKLDFGFFDSRPTGKILARVIGDVNSLKDVLESSVTTLIPDAITVIAVAIIMLILDYRLALATFLALPILIVGAVIIQGRAHKHWQIFRKKNSNLSAFIHESLSGVSIIQSFSAEDSTTADFDYLLDEYNTSFINAVKYGDAFGPCIDISWGIGNFFLYLTAIKIIGPAHIEIGTIIAFATYLSMFYGPIRNLSNFYNKLVTNISGAERIFDILDHKPDISKEETKEMPLIKGNIEFSNVFFSYDNEINILEDVNFQVKAGQAIALVGPTGAGKSTIVNLISRFYDIGKGTITIDGININTVSTESLRCQMGIMTQDNFLFSGTIRENIKYGKLDATEEEIIAAAKAVHAHDFICKLEEGYDTILSERGARLSAGERQLLAFARTMVSSPRILILDEATSSIDTETELLVQKGIDSLLANRTSFVIAHRLSTIRKADCIFVVDDKNILEAGNHEKLLEKKGMYYKLQQAQFLDE